MGKLDVVLVISLKQITSLNGQFIATVDHFNRTEQINSSLEPSLKFVCDEPVTLNFEGDYTLVIKHQPKENLVSIVLQMKHNSLQHDPT